MNDLFEAWGNVQTPYSQEAEEATVGAIIINPDAFIMVSAFLKADDFFILRNRYIWEAFVRLEERGDPIDYLTVCNELKAVGKLSEIGGPVYITQLSSNTPTSVHAEIYGHLVERAAIRRRMLAAADDIKALALNEELPVDDVIASAEKTLVEVTRSHQQAGDVSFYESVSEYFDTVDHLMNDPQYVVGIPSGLKEYDNLTLGFQAPDCIIIAARPGMGKSALLLTMTMNRLRECPGAQIGWFCLEMSRQQMTQRAVSLEAGINIQTLKNGSLSPQEWQRFVAKSGEISKYGLHIDDRSQVTPAQMRAKIYQWTARFGKLDYVCVDYLQLMRGGGKFGTREQEISHISEELKNIAKEFNIPVLAAAQLSRSLESRQDKRPMLSDLRESGAIEQNADIVTFLYRDDYYNPATESPNQAELITAKHRNGPTGTNVVHFEKTLTKFTNAVIRNVNFATGEYK